VEGHSRLMGQDEVATVQTITRERIRGGLTVKIPQAIKTLIESGCPAHLVTLNRDGSPQVTLLWLGVEGDELVAGHLSKHQKVKNVLRDPRVAISLPGVDEERVGAHRVCGRGRESSHPGGRRARAAPKAGGGLPWAWRHVSPMENPPSGYVTRIRADRVEGVGPWTGRPV
jgi:hypothetical protein